MSKIHCESCGNIVQPIDRFCLKCGASLRSSKTVATERTQSADPKQKQSSQTTPHRQEAQATGYSRTPIKTAGLSKPRKRSSNIPWLIKAELIGLILIAVGTVVLATRKGTNHDEAIVNSPTATNPPPLNMRVPTSTFASVLPTAPPTPASAPGSVHAQADQVMEAYQDMEVGRRWSVWLLKGDKAYLDQDGNVLEVQDAQGRVILEYLGGDWDRVRIYAWEGGYNTSVGSGYLLLKAGYSYTQNQISIDWDNEVVEVRQISNDQLVGYALLIKNYNSNGSFTGYETPAAFIDNNSDGLVSIQELDTALAELRTDAILISESQPSLAERFNTDINSAYAAINSGVIADAYLKTKQLQLDVTNTVP